MPDASEFFDRPDWFKDVGSHRAGIGLLMWGFMSFPLYLLDRRISPVCILQSI